jgi:hypothetical protein
MRKCGGPFGAPRGVLGIPAVMFRASALPCIDLTDSCPSPHSKRVLRNFKTYSSISGVLCFVRHWRPVQSVLVFPVRLAFSGT